MNIVIVDDEPFARQTLIAIITENFNNINIVGEAASVDTALKVINDKKPELVFLDIDIIGGSGFDVLARLPEINFKLIFITAHQEYAIKAIKFSALDYILKPVCSAELINSLNKIINSKTDINNKSKLDVFINNMRNTGIESRKIVLNTSESMYLVNVSDIIRCQADNNYTTIYTTNEEKIVMSKGLLEYESLLCDYGFVRVHQSHLVNIDFIAKFDKREGGFLVLTDKTQIPVSQRKRQTVFEIFHQLK